eukprot:TRINITY_DN15165_c0_g1_i4.p1 TRINITY_DN15165_c0_g1~~TRINITY_DN15165_c0_g1_i4.p1  ORF type:complete len:568 (+),score=68.86 TRINITY_DN15165_c0_g1_i4:87-1790(+)
MDSIIVLGQSLNPDGSAPATLSSRVMTAASHWHARPQSLLICSGGDPAGTGTSEARTMYEAMKASGVPEGAPYLLEEQSLTTVGNAVECVPLLRQAGIVSLALVTSDFHMPRALYFFEAVLSAYGLPIVVTPVVASTSLPRPHHDVGINAQTLVRRVLGELRFVPRVEDMLQRHNPNVSVPLPSLGVSRTNEALAALRELLASQGVVLQSARSGKYLRVHHGAATVVQDGKLSEDSVWRLCAQEDGGFMVCSSSTGVHLNARDSIIVAQHGSPNAASRWAIEAVGPAEFRLTNLESGKHLHVPRHRADEDMAALVNHASESDGSTWKVLMIEEMQSDTAHCLAASRTVVTVGSRSFALPWKTRSSKQIVFLRHGESAYNAFRSHGNTVRVNADRSEASLLDAMLTPLGEQQAQACQEVMEGAQLVVSSPLRRSMQTAELAVPNRGVPFVLLAELAEAKHAVCDLGIVNLEAAIQSISNDASPCWDCSQLDHTAWDRDNAMRFLSLPPCEGDEEVAARAARAWQWLLAREEERIVVICHGVFMKDHLLHLDATLRNGMYVSATVQPTP